MILIVVINFSRNTKRTKRTLRTQSIIKNLWAVVVRRGLRDPSHRFRPALSCRRKEVSATPSFCQNHPEEQTHMAMIAMILKLFVFILPKSFALYRSTFHPRIKNIDRRRKQKLTHLRSNFLCLLP